MKKRAFSEKLSLIRDKYQRRLELYDDNGGDFLGEIIEDFDGALEKLEEQMRRQEKRQARHAEAVGRALPFLKDLLKVGALGDGDARALRVALAALRDLGVDKAS